MKLHLRKLEDQVLVITGASSGIGLATAKMAANRGARVVMCSRNIGELERLTKDINREAGERGFAGVRALAVECDVRDPAAVDRVASRAKEEFGGIDTWINNAGVSIYGKLTEVPLEEKRELFDTNFWGVIHGCRTAVRQFRKRSPSKAGALINIGSVVSERAIPIQGIYSASKHAVKAYTDALRMELESMKMPISVTLVKPASIDTPYTEHAINHLKHKPTLPPPVYAPEIVANAILEAAEKPMRDVFVGGGGKLMSAMETLMPRLTDLIMEHTMMEEGQSNAKRDDEVQRPALHHAPSKEGETRGSYPGHVIEQSAYTSAALHPGLATMIAAGLGAIAAVGIGYWQSSRSSASAVSRDSLETGAEAVVHH